MQTATLDRSRRIVNRTKPQENRLEIARRPMTRLKDGRLPGQARNGGGLAITTDFCVIHGEQLRRVYAARLGDTRAFWVELNGERVYLNAADLVLREPIPEQGLNRYLDR